MEPTAAQRWPATGGDLVTFSLDDPAHRLSAVRLVSEVDLGVPTDLARTGRCWVGRFPQPAEVDRLEYLFEISDRRRRTSTLADPANPLRARGAFGEKSVLELPGYRAPEWLGWPSEAGTTAPLEIPAPSLEAAINGFVWTPEGLPAEAPAPLLLVHDGPEYDAYADLTRCLGALLQAGELPPLRAALCAPGDRNEWYSANPDYAAALSGSVLPALCALVPVSGVIGLGASLGALALLHLERTHPGLFDGLVLQSGSFFTRKGDGQEAGFVGFEAVTAFVEALHAASGSAGSEVPVALTCGLGEENLANNRLMAATLGRLGYRSGLSETRDAHNFTAWRDALGPSLVTLVGAARAAS